MKKTYENVIKQLLDNVLVIDGRTDMEKRMNLMKLPLHLVAGFIVALFLLASCATTKNEEGIVEISPNTAAVMGESHAPYSKALAETVDRKKTGAEDPDRAKVFKGTGVMVKGQQPGGAVPGGASLASQQGSGSVVLNFEAADLREVIRNILGDILGEAYLIDPSINGQVTIRTTAGVSRDALYATLETLLRMNNATMVKEGSVFKILPAAAGVKGSVTPQLGNSQRPLPKGYSVQIVPLRYVSAKEMMKILEPFAKDAQAVRSDDLRNLLVLSGTELELRHLLETIDMFDIDWMSGMSVGIFTLKNTDVKSLAQDIQGALGGDNAALLGGVLKFIPIERMNALMVISPQPAYLDEAKKWIEKFDDMGAGGEGPRFYVYSLKYARAEKVAPLLQQAFTGRVTTPAKAPATLAPGMTGAVTMSPSSIFQPGGRTSITQPQTAASGGINRPPMPFQQQGVANNQSGQINAGAAANAGSGVNRAVVRGGAVGTSADGGMGIAREIQAVPDEDNNAILIVATPGEYALVEQALKKLDIPQRQIVMEVTMAEVKLNDSMSVGSKWWFKGGDVIGGLGAVSGIPAPDKVAASAFNLILKPGSSIDAIISASEQAGNIKLVANPHIAALDNQEASIAVTQSIPYSNSITIGTDNNNIQNSYQYATVGITVKIKPHINDGGNVSMEAAIEFSTVDPSFDATVGGAPPTNARAIMSQLMVPSGGTMVIGGLIQDDVSNNTGGVPFLSRIPVLGALFGNQTWKNQRTELVIFITPRVVNDDESRRRIIQDIRYRMDNLEGVLQKSKALPLEISQKLDAIPAPQFESRTSQEAERKCLGQECQNKP